MSKPPEQLPRSDNDESKLEKPGDKPDSPKALHDELKPEDFRQAARSESEKAATAASKLPPIELSKGDSTAQNAKDVPTTGTTGDSKSASQKPDIKEMFAAAAAIRAALGYYSGAYNDLDDFLRQKSGNRLHILGLVDDETINTVLKDKTETERKAISWLYNSLYRVNLEDDIKKKLSGSDLDKTLNYLHRKDGDIESQDAQRIHAALLERGNLLFGRKDAAIEEDIRQTLSTKHSGQLDAMNAEYRNAYGVTLVDAIAKDPNLSAKTKEACAIYLSGLDKSGGGTDRRTPEEFLKLAEIALNSKDIAMFQEAMRDAPKELRDQFKSEEGRRKLVGAFWPKPGLVGSSRGHISTNYTDLVHALDAVNFGKLSAASQVRDNTGIVNDNEQAIELALSRMTDDERTLYRRGKELIAKPGNGDKLSESDQQAVNYYQDLRTALDRAGNKTELARWEDMVDVPGGTLLSRLAAHRGSVYDDSVGSIVSDIENMTSKDWKRLREDAAYRDKVNDVLKEYLNDQELARCKDILDAKTAKSVSSFEQSQVIKRPIEKVIDDNVHWYGTDRSAILDGVTNMTPADRKRYREDGQFRQDLNKKLEEELGNSGPTMAAQRMLSHIAVDKLGVLDGISRMTELEQRRYREDADYRAKFDQQLERILAQDPALPEARRMLGQVLHGHKPDAEDIITKLGRHSLKPETDAGGPAVRDIVQAFHDDPTLQERISHPKTAEDQIVSQKFKEAAATAFSSPDYVRYVQPLIDHGRLPLATRLELSKGIVNDDEEGVYKDILSANPEERKMLLTDKAKRDELLGFLSENERAVVVNCLKQDGMHTEDNVRSLIVGYGGSKEIIAALQDLKPGEIDKLKTTYAKKYDGDLEADLLKKLGGDEKIQVKRLLRIHETDSERFNSARDEYYDANSGIARSLVELGHSGTPFQADDAVNVYAKQLAEASRQFHELTPKQQEDLQKQLREAIDLFRESKGAAADYLVNGIMTVGAVGGAAFTGGVSLSLLAYVAAAGAAVKVGTKALVLGSDYDARSQALLDALTGGGEAATMFVGPGEIMAITGIGKSAAMRAAGLAAKELAEQSTKQLLKVGAEEVMEQGVAKLTREAIASGAKEIDKKAIVKLANELVDQKITGEARERAVKKVTDSLTGSLKEGLNLEARSWLKRTVTEYALTTGAGSGGAAASGAVEGATEWDPLLGVDENLKRLGARVGMAAVSGGAGAVAFTTAAKGVKAGYKKLSGGESPHTDALGPHEPAPPPNASTDIPRGDGATTPERPAKVSEGAEPKLAQPEASALKPAESVAQVDKVTGPVPPEALKQSNEFVKSHELKGRIEDGWVNTGTGRELDAQGKFSAPWHGIVVDRQSDTVLQQVITDAKQRFGSLPEKERAESLTRYVKEVMTRPGAAGADGGEQALNQQYLKFMRDHAGERVPLGEFIRLGNGSCREQATLLKVLADEVGLKATLVRGNGSNAADVINHAWTNIEIGGKPYIYDPRQGHAGMTPEQLASTHKPGKDIDLSKQQNPDQPLYFGVRSGDKVYYQGTPDWKVEGYDPNTGDMILRHSGSKNVTAQEFHAQNPGQELEIGRRYKIAGVNDTADGGWRFVGYNPDGSLKMENEGAALLTATREQVARTTPELSGNVPPTGKSAGDVAQEDLFRFATMRVKVQPDQTTPELREVFDLRAKVQKKLDSGWQLIQTGKDSAADMAGMDYILFNEKDKRYFFLDATLNRDAKANLPELRKENVIPIDIAPEGKAPDVESKKRFLQRILELTDQPSPLNFSDTKPPSTRALSLAEKEAEITAFRNRLEGKAKMLEAQAEKKGGQEGAELRKQAEQLRDYSDDLHRSKTFADKKLEQGSDPNFARESQAFQDNFKRAAKRAVADYLSGADTASSAGKVIPSADQSSRRIYPDNKRGILVLETGGKRYELDRSTVNKLVEDAFKERFSQSAANKPSDKMYGLKRAFEAGQGKKQVLEGVLDRLERIPTDELLGRQEASATRKPLAKDMSDRLSGGSEERTAGSKKAKVEERSKLTSSEAPAKNSSQEVIPEDTAKALRSVWEGMGGGEIGKGYDENVHSAMQMALEEQQGKWTAEQAAAYKKLLQRYESRDEATIAEVKQILTGARTETELAPRADLPATKPAVSPPRMEPPTLPGPMPVAKADEPAITGAARGASPLEKATSAPPPPAEAKAMLVAARQNDAVSGNRPDGRDAIPAAEKVTSSKLNKEEGAEIAVPREPVALGSTKPVDTKPTMSLKDMRAKIDQDVGTLDKQLQGNHSTSDALQQLPDHVRSALKEALESAESPSEQRALLTRFMKKVEATSEVLSDVQARRNLSERQYDAIAELIERSFAEDFTLARPAAGSNPINPSRGTDLCVASTTTHVLNKILPEGSVDALLLSAVDKQVPETLKVPVVDGRPNLNNEHVMRLYGRTGEGEGVIGGSSYEAVLSQSKSYIRKATGLEIVSRGNHKLGESFEPGYYVIFEKLDNGNGHVFFGQVDSSGQLKTFDPLTNTPNYGLKGKTYEINKLELGNEAMKSADGRFVRYPDGSGRQLNLGAGGEDRWAKLGEFTDTDRTTWQPQADGTWRRQGDVGSSSPAISDVQANTKTGDLRFTCDGKVITQEASGALVVEFKDPGGRAGVKSVEKYPDGAVVINYAKGPAKLVTPDHAEWHLETNGRQKRWVAADGKSRSYDWWDHAYLLEDPERLKAFQTGSRPLSAAIDESNSLLAILEKNR